MLRLLIIMTGTKWWTIAELAEASRVPMWSVRRDLLVFKDAGVPIESTPEVIRRGTAGRYRLSKDWTQKFLGDIREP